VRRILFASNCCACCIPRHISRTQKDATSESGCVEARDGMTVSTELDRTWGEGRSGLIWGFVSGHNERKSDNYEVGWAVSGSGLELDTSSG
jgi:hypothetical protein